MINIDIDLKRLLRNLELLNPDYRAHDPRIQFSHTKRDKVDEYALKNI